MTTQAKKHTLILLLLFTVTQFSLAQCFEEQSVCTAQQGPNLGSSMGQQFIACQDGSIDQIELNIFNAPSPTIMKLEIYNSTTNWDDLMWTVPNIPVTASGSLIIDLKSGYGNTLNVFSNNGYSMRFWNIGLEVFTLCESLSLNDPYIHGCALNHYGEVQEWEPAFLDFTFKINFDCTNAGTDYQTACKSYTWIDGNTYFESNNTATYTLSNSAGCDSLVTLNLTINNECTVPTDNLILDTIIADGRSACFNAEDQIIVARNDSVVVLETGSSTTFIAGQSILFQSGFHAFSGSYMDAHITNDRTFCNVQPTAADLGNIKTTEIKSVKVGIDLKKIISGTLNIFPNPTNGTVTIEGLLEGKLTNIFVYNVLGKKVMNVITRESAVEIDISNQKNGVYILSVLDGGNKIFKIVKK